MTAEFIPGILYEAIACGLVIVPYAHITNLNIFPPATSA